MKDGLITEHDVFIAFVDNNNQDASANGDPHTVFMCQNLRKRALLRI